MFALILTVLSRDYSTWYPLTPCLVRTVSMTGNLPRWDVRSDHPRIRAPYILGAFRRIRPMQRADQVKFVVSRLWI